MSAPRKIWLQYSFDMLDKHDDQPFPGSTAYHHDDVMRELAAALEEIVEHCRNTGRGCVAVNDRIYERCEETAVSALAKIAQEG